MPLKGREVRALTVVVCLSPRGVPLPFVSHGLLSNADHPRRAHYAMTRMDPVVLSIVPLSLGFIPDLVPNSQSKPSIAKFVLHASRSSHSHSSARSVQDSEIIQRLFIVFEKVQTSFIVPDSLSNLRLSTPSCSTEAADAASPQDSEDDHSDRGQGGPSDSGRSITNAKFQKTVVLCHSERADGRASVPISSSIGRGYVQQTRFPGHPIRAQRTDDQAGDSNRTH